VRKFINILIFVVFIIALIIYLIVKVITGQLEFGGKMDESSQAFALKSVQYVDDHFENSPPKVSADTIVNFKELMGGQMRHPSALFPMETPDINRQPKSGLRAIWFGHATAYVEMDGKRIMTDPMLSKRAFPVKLMAPTRYNPSPLEMEKLPAIDFVTISHDHFDHLDMKTTQTLAANGAQFFVGIGIKAHLIRWSVPESQIHEMDWWQSVTIGEFTIHCTPARHYSGRTLSRDTTLWSSWVIEGPKHRIYHSGDTGYSPHFKEIGERFGPINIAFIKIGDYGLDLSWRDVHMHPEKSIQAHLDLNADVMFPIHWGTFALSFHDWFEPINLAVEYANQNGVKLVTPKLGQKIEYNQPIKNQSWWKPLEIESREK